MITDFEAQQIIQREIQTSENLLWAGRPIAGLRLQLADLLLIPFSLMWTGFAVYWELSVMAEGWTFGAFWGIPFVAIGIYMTFGRFYADTWQRRRTTYGITSSRIIIISGLFQRSIESLSLRTLGHVTLSERANGRGTIKLGTSNVPMTDWFQGTGWPGMGRYAVPMLDSVENVRAVYDQLRQAQQQLQAGA